MKGALMQTREFACVIGGNFVKYKIVDSDYIGGLEVIVNDHIGRGWIPQGGVTIMGTEKLQNEADIGPVKFMQPMIHNDISWNDPDPISSSTKMIETLSQNGDLSSVR